MIFEKCHTNRRNVSFLQQDRLLNGGPIIKGLSQMQVVDLTSEKLTHLNERHQI